MLALGLDCLACDERLQKERGCKEKGIVPFYLQDGQHFRCPLKLLTPITVEYLQAYKFYQKALLPNGTGFKQESEKYLEAMAVLDNEMVKQEQQQQKQQQKKVRHG